MPLCPAAVPCSLHSPQVGATGFPAARARWRLPACLLAQHPVAILPTTHPSHPLLCLLCPVQTRTSLTKPAARQLSSCKSAHPCLPRAGGLPCWACESAAVRIVLGAIGAPASAAVGHVCLSTCILSALCPLCSVLAAYSYLSPAAAYNYSRPGTSGPPDPAAAGAAVGREAAARTAQQWQAFRGACRKSDSGMGAGQALRRLLAAAGSGKETSTGSSSSTGSVRSRSRAGLASAAGGTQELPPPGSYAAALLAAFEDDTNQAAHAAAWRVKHEVMRHNVQLARQFLAGAAPL